MNFKGSEQVTPLNDTGIGEGVSITYREDRRAFREGSYLTTIAIEVEV